MKKNSIFLIGTIVFFLIFFSCKKDHPIIPGGPETGHSSGKPKELIPGVFLTGDRLWFTDRSVFDSTLNNGPSISTINNSSFYSQRKKVGSTFADTSDTFDELLGTILNPNGIVQIGDWICKVDITNEVVTVLNIKKIAYYSDLVNNISNPHIITFSTDDEVLSILEDSAALSNARVALFRRCHDAHAHREHVEAGPGGLVYTGSNGNSYSAKIKHSYQAAGIYFSLESKIKNLAKDQLIFWKVNPDGFTDLFLIYDYQVRCNGRSAFNHVGVYVEDQTGPGSGLPDGNSKQGIVECRLYAGSRALKEYYLSTEGRYTDVNAQSNGGPIPSYTLQSIQSN